MTGKVVFCKVNQFTRADEVANAMDGYRQELGSEVKLKGHKLPGGEIALYWSTKRSTLWERLTGKAAERRRLARIAFKQVQKNEHWALEKDVCFMSTTRRPFRRCCRAWVSSKRAKATV
jgi:hypothetical protein